MRVAQIAPFYGQEIGGAENSTSLLFSYLRKQGIDLTVFSIRRTARAQGAYVVPFLNWAPATIVSVGNPVLDVLATRLLRDALGRSERFDLVHVQDVNLLQSVAPAASRLNLPVVATVRDPMPKVISRHNYPAPLVSLVSPLYRHEEQKRLSALGKCTRVIAVSQFIKDRLASEGVPAEKIEAIYNPVGWAFHEEYARIASVGAERAQGPLRILATGRLSGRRAFTYWWTR